MKVVSSTRYGFTLLEMMIALTIFSAAALFLYHVAGILRVSNEKYTRILDEETLRHDVVKTLYLDLALVTQEPLALANTDGNGLIFSAQSEHSVHRRTRPYVGYVLKDGTLYRFESANSITLPVTITKGLIVDKLLRVKALHIYKNPTHFLVHIRFESETARFFKVHALNL